MSFFAAYKIIPESNLIIENFKGVITSESFLSFKTKVVSDKDYTKAYNYLDDYRDATFDTTRDEVKLYLDFAKKYEIRNSAQKSALLTETPNQVVMLSIYELLKSDFPDMIRIFSTLKFAYSWLNLSYKEKNMANEILNDLKNSIETISK